MRSIFYFALIGVIVTLFYILPIKDCEPIVYAIFITIVISGADLFLLDKLWKKIKGEEKNPLL